MSTSYKISVYKYVSNYPSINSSIIVNNGSNYRLSKLITSSQLPFVTPRVF